MTALVYCLESSRLQHREEKPNQSLAAFLSYVARVENLEDIRWREFTGQSVREERAARRQSEGSF